MNNGILALIIDSLTLGNINIINNKVNLTFDFLYNIRITSHNNLNDHDNYLFIFKKKVDEKKSNIEPIIKKYKLPGNRYIKCAYDNCKNYMKSAFSCNNGFFNLFHKKIYTNYFESLKNNGIKKLICIEKFAVVDFNTYFDAIKEVEFDAITFIFIDMYLNSETSYIFEKFVYYCKYKYGYQILFMNDNELKNYTQEIDSKTYIYNRTILHEVSNKDIQDTKIYLGTLFKDIKIVWHTAGRYFTKLLCTAFPNIQFNFIANYHESDIENHYVKIYNQLNMSNLKIYLSITPFKPFPGFKYNKNEELPIHAFYYSTFLEYANDGDLIFSSFFV